MSMKRLALVVVIAALVAGCSQPSASSAQGACYGGSPRFPRAMLDGPQLTAEQFVGTEQGQIATSFFVSGEGAVEGAWFPRAEGFSIVSSSLVLAYRHGAVESFMTLEDGRVTSWGSCIPTLVRSGAETARWTPTEGWDRNSTVIPIKVKGGACVTGTRTRVITKIVDVDVTESADEVQVVVWTKERFTLSCAGVGIDLDSEITLSSPLGDRALTNAGFIPPERVDQ